LGARCQYNINPEQSLSLFNSEIITSAHLEEPRNLSQELDQQRSFSPNITLVRNSSAVATTTVTVDNGGATHVSPLTSSTAQKYKEL
jgi:hypothetical protein